jgi:hypothetical protein
MLVMSTDCGGGLVSSRRGVRGRNLGSVRMPVVLIGILLALAAASPFVTSWLNALPLDWKGMSDVGQAYGALSAALSAFALCGVVASLLMQRQQYRLSENHGIRVRHRELIKMTFEDPSLKPCWGESSNLRLSLSGG